MLVDRTVDRRYGPSTARPYGAGAPATGTATGRAYTVAGRSVGIATAQLAGRAVVLYVDLPAGDDLDIIDLSRVRLQENPAPAP
jgi:hypothetical protein